MIRASKLCLKCQKEIGRYQCSHCQRLFCFVHCAGHGCDPSAASTQEMPILPTKVPHVMLSDYWGNLSVALQSTTALYLTDNPKAGWMGLAAPTLDRRIAQYTCLIADVSPNMFTEYTADTLDDLILGMSVADQELLDLMLSHLAQHPYDATIPPDARIEGGAR